ncbi:hypothetical protein AAFC00_002623 [Neodothiora populina]|uniref:Methyltransferase n=1 Tax=Neodothiora populina TaxID=2781224 RepID=A0ABR3P7P7_9PEZI
MSENTKIISSQVYFLKKDPKYDTVKPYSLRFTPPAGFPRANVELEAHDITIEDVRPVVKELSLKKNGFSIMPLESSMQYEDFNDKDKVIDVYLRELSNTLRQYLGATRVQIFEHTIRKRHEIFPISTGEPYQYNQPTSMAHVDTTVPWAVSMARTLNDGNNDVTTNGHLQCVNVWKPIIGPVRDWPLAMCDPRTVVPKEDHEPCDLVYPDYVVENLQLYFRPTHRWVYLSDQQVSEAWVFVQSDTENGQVAVPHTSFPNPLASPDDPSRESIEARALVYYT